MYEYAVVRCIGEKVFWYDVQVVHMSCGTVSTETMCKMYEYTVVQTLKGHK